MLLASLASLWQWWPTDAFFDWFMTIFVVGLIASIVFTCVIIGIIIYAITRATKSRAAVSTTYGVTAVPATPVREVIHEALPTKCPACLAPISYQQVTWVGPRQAKCPYCGNIIELQQTVESQ